MTGQTRERKWTFVNQEKSKLPSFYHSLRAYHASKPNAPLAHRRFKRFRRNPSNYVGTIKSGDLDPAALKMISILPFSGEEIELAQAQDVSKFTLTSKAYSFTDQSLLKINAQVLNSQMNSFRSSKQTTALSSYQQIEFFAHATRYLKLMTRDILSHIPKERRASISHRYDSTALVACMSLETLSPVAVATHLLPLITDRYHSAFYLDHYIKSLTPSKSQIEAEFEQMQHLSLALIKELTNIHNHLPTKVRDYHRVNLPVKEMRDLEQFMSSSSLGNLICNPSKEPNTLARLNVKVDSIQAGSSEFKILERATLRWFEENFAISLPIEASDGNMLSEVEQRELSLQPFTKLIHDQLMNTEYESDYTNQRMSVEHLGKSARDETMQSRTEELLNKYDKSLSILKNPNPDLNALVQLLRNSPANLNQAYEALSQLFGAEVKFGIQIREMHNQIAPDSDLKNLSEVIVTKQIATDQAHKILIEAINSMNSAVTMLKELKIELRERSTKMVSGMQGQAMVEEIKEAEGILKLGYEEKLKLFVDDRIKLNQFKNEVHQIINQFKGTIEGKNAESVVTHSGSNAALMIGLGQGGEQIVRAAMAKMLNTTSDARSNNLLTGLNLNMEEVKDMIRKRDGEIDLKISDSDKDYAEFKKLFKNANIIAINTGPEQKTMLSQPYNYIWGGSKDTIYGIQNKYAHTSNSTMLLDIEGKGCGGQMGKGRGFATDAGEAIAEAIRRKKLGQTISQVCIVHSFAGGSGSGMILPVLSKVKQVLPNAVVWVFSAGDTAHGKAKYSAENVSYITSDVLQSHYNALHHEPETITEQMWTRFGRTIRSTRSELSKDWKAIAQCLPELGTQDEIETRIDDTNKDLWKKLSEDKKTLIEMGMTATEQSITLPCDNSSTRAFSEFVKNPSNYSIALKSFANWMHSVEDDGSITLRTSRKLESIFGDNEKSNKVEETSYRCNYAHFVALANGVAKMTPESRQGKSIDDIKDDLATQNNPFMRLTLTGISCKIPQGYEPFEDLGDLRTAIMNYASKMRLYHQEVYEMFERVKMNLMVSDDPLVKHVILSNAHLDSASTFYKGTPKYEIYNSAMIDVFVNLVHSLVSSDDYDPEDLTAISTSYEVMDLNDMKNRTKPTVGASLLSLKNTQPLDSQIYFDVGMRDDIHSHAAWDLFKSLFELGESPLYNQGDNLDRGPKTLPEIDALRALYMHYLSKRNGIRRFCPSDCIDSFSKLEPKPTESLLLSEDCVWLVEHWNCFLKEKIENKERLKEEGIEIREFTNMVNWIRIFNPENIDLIYANRDTTTLKEFQQRTTDWRSLYTSTLQNETPNHPLNEVARRVTLENSVAEILSGSHANTQTMSELLLRFGIIDDSHLAIVPSALIYEYSPVILRKILGDSLEVHLHGIQTKPMDWNKNNRIAKTFEEHPLPVTRLSRISPNSPWRKDTKTKERLENVQPQKNEWKFVLSMKSGKFSSAYLRVPIIKEMQDDIVPMFDISPVFMNDFATLKNELTKKHPEFSNSTVLDKMIFASSNPHTPNGKRTNDEKPSFRHAWDDLLTHSSPKMLSASELPQSVLLRTLLLGSQNTEDTQQKALYKVNVPDSKEDWFTKIQAEGTHKFDDKFTMKQFKSALNARLKSLMNCKHKDETLTGSFLEFLKEKLDGHQDEIDGKEIEPKSIFDSLHENFDNKKGLLDFYQKSPRDFGLTEWNQVARSAAILFSRLSSLTFAATRQQNFERGEMNPGSGVAYEFEGSLDAVRSVTDDYLMVVNTSVDLDVTAIERSVNYYFNEYLLSDDKLGDVKGKTFVQRIKSGPLAHLTLVSQKTAVTEISENYNNLMILLKSKRFEAVAGPKVHPYSFIRNILWLHTFQDVWLNKANNGFTDMLEIPTDVIKHVIGKPKVIKETVLRVQQSGDMLGTNLPQRDVDLFDQVGLLQYDLTKGEADTEEDTIAKNKRLLSQLHIPDMIVINYLRELRNEGNDTSMSDLFETPPEELDNIFPSNRYLTKFKRSGLTTQTWSRKVQNVESDDDDFDEDWDDLEPLTGSAGEKKSDAWLNALKKWIDYVNSTNNIISQSE